MHGELEYGEIISAYVGERDACHESGISQKTRDDLDWGQVVARLSYHCHSELTEALALRLPFLEEPGAVARRLAESDEALRLVVAGDIPPLGGLCDLKEPLEYCRRGGVLEGPQLLDIARAAQLSEDVSGFFANRAAQSPLLAQVASELGPLGGLAQTLTYALDDEGRLRDRASPDLGSLRRRVRALTGQVRKKAESYLKDQDFERFLQDQFFTIRDNRFVLPIRVGEQSHVPGIVHGRSGSGQTVFIEPTELLEMNNGLSLAQLEVEREVFQILSRLSREVAKSVAMIRSNADYLVYLDLSIAAGRLAREMDALFPSLVDDHRVQLKGARHPLLALRYTDTEGAFDVVSNDILFGGDEPPILLISGPNAGGKTVVLKTVGLFALMVRAGLLVPCEDGSSMPIFSQIFSDIGDEQSLADDLSSFSAHAMHLKGLLPSVGPSSLVLLDELFSGTDTTQGAALGAALLEHLAGEGALVVASTHFEPLKRFALHSPVVSNASMGFQVETLSPTFVLRIGYPGSSNALRIAERLGFPSKLLTRAEELSREEGSNELENLLNELDSHRERLAKRDGELKTALEAAHREERRYQRERKLMKEEALTAVDSEIATLYDEVSEAQALVRRRRKALTQPRDALTQDALADAQADLNRAKATVRRREDKRKRAEVRKERQPIPSEDLEPGLEVWVAPVKRTGTIVEVGPKRKRARLIVGNVKASFSTEDLYRPADAELPAPKRKAKPKAEPPSRKKMPSHGEPQNEAELSSVGLQTKANTLDLRGERVEEALDRLDRFLDSAYGSRLPGIYVIHGHGTGALKEAVRRFTRESVYVQSQRPGERGEGGDGVTVIEIKL